MRRVTERDAMHRAMELALNGWGRVSPNPIVGAILLKDGKVVGEGWHAEFGGPHAEVMAIEAAGEAARGSTCVVTLEPCNHQGKTGPCTEALIAAGVARVVCAVRDPSPEAGGGLERLAEAGIAVSHGLKAEEIARNNAAFLCSAMHPERPWIAIKVATSAEGFLADERRVPLEISSPPARAWVHWLRAGMDAVAVGRGTLEADDPALTARHTVMPRVQPTRVVFTRTGAVDPQRMLFRSASAIPTVIATTAAGEAVAKEAGILPPIEFVVGEDLAALLGGLRARGIRSLLVEGGAGLAQSLIAADVVDRIYWVRAPRALGAGISAFGEFRPGEAEGWTVTEGRALGPDTLLVTDRRLCLPDS